MEKVFLLSLATATSDKALLIWSCILLTLILAFGSTVYHKLSSLNKKHHIITYDDSVQIDDEDDD